MNCCPSSQQLEQLLEEQLSEEEQGVIATHVSACAPCQAQLEQLTAVLGAGLRTPRDTGAASKTPEPDFLHQLKRTPPSPAQLGLDREDGEEPVTTPPVPLGAAPPAAEWPVVPGYEVLGVLGRGGMGVVYKARQTALHRLVALKMLLAGAQAAPREQARFRLEAEAVARVQHPNIVQIYDIGTSEGRPYFVLEYVEGGSLTSRTRGDPQPAKAAARLVETLARAIHVAHQQGIVHRDLKPSNILLASAVRPPPSPIKDNGPSADDNGPRAADYGQPKITDFGLAKRLEGSDAWTQTGEVVGTPSYMAPEQAAGKGRRVGPAVDVYALGAILYEMLTGQPPFQAATPLETVLQVLHEEPVPPGRLVPQLPRDLEAVCLKCLEKEPHRRYASAEALADDLARWRRGEPTRARPLRWPARVQRAARRHPFASAATILFAVAVVVMTVVSHWPTPARELQQIQRELMKGQAVTLIGESGPPRWFEPSTYPAHTRIATAPGEVSVESQEMALVELLPDPKIERYSFRVEVRHDDCYAKTGEVGIYFAHSRKDTSEGRRMHYFHGLAFNDRIDRSQPTPRIRVPGNLVQLFMKPQEESEEGLVNIRFSPRSQKLQEWFTPIACDGTQEPWRKLAVTVTPEKLRAFWQGQPMIWSDIAQGADGKPIRLIQDFLDKGMLGNTLGNTFEPLAGLGLYVYCGSASFRRAVVEPLGKEN
jgi:serine/threonine protein kinase